MSQHRFHISFEEKRLLFYTEFINSGVERSLALKASEILAFGKSDELLTEGEKQIVNVACHFWLTHRKYAGKPTSKTDVVSEPQNTPPK